MSMMTTMMISSGTSLCLSPSGNFLWAGFSDGTLRVFDLCGRFSLQADESWENGGRQKSTMMLPSKFHQRFGAVACQIHARGVHTDLLMQVDMCGDYVFGGVPRGANELYAVSTRDLEAQAAHGNSYSSSTTANILDSIHVHVHADAKLKGFGACTQLQHASRPTYLLLTGKGIKNIHIWKFQPPLNNKNHEEEPVWEQLYDTQTNGNTISLLSFYRNPLGKLMGVSQSDTQKLRLWDLSREEQEDTTTSSSTTNSHCTSIKPRPKRPPYQDVANSQGALGIAGGYGVCGGPTMYNQLSIVSLDQPKSAYNHTELALPGASSAASSLSMGRGRQRRGDLKQVVNVATLPNDSNHALLELDDVSDHVVLAADEYHHHSLTHMMPFSSSLLLCPGFHCSLHSDRSQGRTTQSRDSFGRIDGDCPSPSRLLEPHHLPGKTSGFDSGCGGYVQSQYATRAH